MLNNNNNVYRVHPLTDHSTLQIISKCPWSVTMHMYKASGTSVQMKKKVGYHKNAHFTR